MDAQLNNRIEFLRTQMENMAKLTGDLLHRDVLALSEVLDEQIIIAQYRSSKVTLLDCAL